MSRTQPFYAIIASLLLSSACAPFWQVGRIEDKIDRLVQNTNRETLTELFGQQADTISQKIETLGSEEKEQLDTILASYERGAGTLEEVRTQLFSVVGGGKRVVSTNRGIWVRDEEGQKLKAIARNSSLKHAKRIAQDDLPEKISNNSALQTFTWGTAQLADETTVLFPWELTMSSFTKEIVENTARRTAEQFIKMGGDKAFNRPIHIRVSTAPDGKGLKINYPGDEKEIFVSSESDKEQG